MDANMAKDPLHMQIPAMFWQLAAPPLSSLGGEVRKHSPVVKLKVG